MRQWKSFSALNKVKMGLEVLAYDVTSILEQAIDSLDSGVSNSDDPSNDHEILDAQRREDYFQCIEKLEQIAGVLRIIECSQLVMLVDELIALMKSPIDGNRQLGSKQRRHDWELTFVAMMDFPSILEGVLSGQTEDWQEYSILFNKIRKARGRSVIFSCETLEKNGNVNFRRLFTKNPAQLVEALKNQEEYYSKASALLLKNANHAQGLKVLLKVFSNLEVMYRDFRIGVLWALCKSLTESLVKDEAEKDPEVIKLLCSFSSVMKEGFSEGASVAEENISEHVLEKLLNIIASLKQDTYSLKTIRLWYNLNIKIGKEYRVSHQDMNVRFYRKSALLKSIKLLIEDISSLSEDINEGVGSQSCSEENLQHYVSLLTAIQGTTESLGIQYLAVSLEKAIDLLQAHSEVADSSLHTETKKVLYSTAQALYQAEIDLLSRADELELAVFSSMAGYSESGLLVGAKLNLVQAVVKNLDMVILAINNYVDDIGNVKALQEVSDLLSESFSALSVIPLSRASSFVDGAKSYVDKLIGLDRSIPVDDYFHAFAHLIINMHAYLEQVTTGKAENFEQMLNESDAFIEKVKGFNLEPLTVKENKVETGKQTISSTETPNIDRSLSGSESVNRQVDDVDGKRLAESQEKDPLEPVQPEQDLLKPTLLEPEQLESRQVESEKIEFKQIESEPVETEKTPDSFVSVELKSDKETSENQEVDDEIKEIFIEEANEILEAIEENCLILTDKLENQEALTELRRNFHTLKGSGRMVDATSIGDLSWSIENFLNLCLSGKIEFSPPHLNAIENVKALLPTMVEEFRTDAPQAFNPESVAEMVNIFEQFSKGGSSESADITPVYSPAQATEKAINQPDEQPDEQNNEESVDETRELFIAETERQVARIQSFLDNPETLDDNGHAITTSSFIIPVHTLYGNFRVSELEKFGQVVAPLENLLQSHPYKDLGNNLKQLLSEFCTLTLKVSSHLKNNDSSEFTDEIPGAAEFIQSVAAINLEMSQTTPSSEIIDGALDGTLDEPLEESINAQINEKPEELSAETVEKAVEEILTVPESNDNKSALKSEQLSQEELGKEELRQKALKQEALKQEALKQEALLIQGFLSEANPTTVLINNTFAEFRSSFEDEKQLELLQSQLNNLEGAARLCGQNAFADVCMGLVSAYKQYARKIYVIDESVQANLQKSHDFLGEGIEIIAEHKNVPDSSALVEQLKKAVGQAIQEAEYKSLSEKEKESEDSLLFIFLDEAEEILNDLDNKIADWQLATDDETITGELLRLLHTLKGSAALVGEQELSHASHEFESFIINAKRNSVPLNDEFFKKTDDYLHELQKEFGRYERNESGSFVRREVEQSPKSDSEEEAEGEGLSVNASTSTDTSSSIVDNQPSKQVDNQTDEQVNNQTDKQSENIVQFEPELQQQKPVAVQPVAEKVTTTDVSGKSDKSVILDEQVRVSGNLLRALLNDSDEIGITHNRVEQNLSEFNLLLSDMDETLGRLQGYIENIEQQAKSSQILMSPVEQSGESADFDAIEMDKYTELQQVSLSLLEDYEDLKDIKKNLLGRMRNMGGILLDQQRSMTNLQDGLISSQMVPFTGIVPRLRRLTRQVSAELGKSVSIKFSNPEGKIDRSILQMLASPLEHMIRNSIDHGIETAEERAKLGKPEQAEIVIKLYRQGANVLLDITDDGAGLNRNAIMKKAKENGLLSDGEKVSDHAIYQYVLKAGFSTSEEVSKISGRGVGLDVVHSEILQVGGDVEMFSSPGLGATVKIRLPLTSSLNRSLLFMLNGTQYVMLLNTIDGILMETVESLQRSRKGTEPAFVEYSSKKYEVVHMGSMLDKNYKPKPESVDASVPLLLVTGREKNLALQIDSIVGSRDLVVKSLGSQFSSLAGLSGAVILGDGNVVVVIDPVELVNDYLSNNRSMLQTILSVDAALEEGSLKDKKTILVVDDSITVRKITSAILKRNGMEVILAKNGMEAVEILQDSLPDLMLLDIEMPKMDGFEVASYIRRQDSDVKNIPIIMITSRIGDKHRSRAEELGVNEYMCKPFQEENLLEAISDY